MKPWFEDFPLDWTRDESRAAERLLLAGYPMNVMILTLAQDAGLDLTQLDQMSPVKFLVRSVLTRARRSNRLLTLLAEVLGDPAQEAIHQELRTLVAGHEAEVRDAGMRRKPSLSTLAMLPPAVDAWGPGDDAPLPLATPGLEKTINAAAGFADPALFRLRLAEAEVRTARVDIGGKPNGTGFLVADDLLITNWHVAKNAAAGAVAVFDHGILTVEGGGQGREVPFAEPWLIAHSEHAPVAEELGSAGPPVGTWDFAVVRLAESVGGQAIGANPDLVGTGTRGCYALNGSSYLFDEAEPVLIVGHPEGRPVQLSYASPAQAKESVAHTRVRYQTNTEGGSSGSPVFNRDWRVVALHQAGGPTSTAGEFHLQHRDFNQGIPISGIVAELREQLAGRPELVQLGLG